MRHNYYNVRTHHGACPTIHVWDTDDGCTWYFRLRNGSWKVCDDWGDETLLSGKTQDYDGVISWDDTMRLLADNGLSLFPL